MEVLELYVQTLPQFLNPLAVPPHHPSTRHCPGHALLNFQPDAL